VRKISIVGVTAGLSFATIGLGKYIDGDDGKLAVSNLASVLFVVVAAVYFDIYRRGINRGIVGFFLVFNLLAWISFLLFMFDFGWRPNYPVLMFQEVEIVFSLLLVWYGHQDYEEFRVVARVGTILSAVTSVYYGARQLMGGESIMVMTFGMDDKSQAAVLFCCQAFILVRYFGKTIDNVVAGVLLLISLTTLSRLPVLFVPVIFLAIAVRSRAAAVVAAFVVGASGLALISAGDSVTRLFKVFDRLSSAGAVAGDDATSAHLLLLQTAIQLKFTNVMAFFFGTGPGNFAGALTSFPISLAKLSAVDPTLIAAARIGRAPMHSTPFSILLDFNILLFCYLGYLLLRVVDSLCVKGRYVELLFVCTLFVASMFYSLHNKAYLFLVCACIFIFVRERDSRKRVAMAYAADGQLIATPGRHAKSSENYQ
jgi:hypothetical protein